METSHPTAATIAWLQSVSEQAAEAVSRLADQRSISGTHAETLVGPVQRDPWVALLTESWYAQRMLTGKGLPSKLVGKALTLCGCWPTARDLVESVSSPLSSAAKEAVLRAAFRPAAPWRAVRDRDGPPARRLAAPHALGPPDLCFAAAPFWALMTSPPREAVVGLLELLTEPIAAEAFTEAAPPWLPFFAFVSILSTPLGDGWVWTEGPLRAQLFKFVSLYFAQEPAWLVTEVSDWLQESLRGLCDRLCRVFMEESFGDVLLARTLWAFATPCMPLECREVVWGGKDLAVLLLLRRTLPAGDTEHTLLWPLKTYLEPLEEDAVLQRATETLKAEEEQHGPRGRSSTSWPVVLLKHHHALREGCESPLQGGCDVASGVPGLGGLD
eukprot:gnl/TRDRNA2_/TRDRNA2_111180_c2_seq1.p1 gnl/TRDRNA2_/TRDRNA2_111180_c2~~gnl/TRDRNA2_/TRDRNA2_111180_c2_seq1.p1  ORF type:complete len:396 (+),score=46.21 gnl/TRDRNA2_/TRDRNA2_111180_c2_seq1:36-1190(+)